MDSVLCLDTSGSMAGFKLQQLKAAVLAYTNDMEQENLGGMIGIVEFGSNIGLRVSLTTNFSKIRNSTKNLTATGNTPMGKGLVIALKELAERGRIINLGRISIRPRLILMTDGAPDNREEVLVVAKLFGDAGIPIACVGVSGCDVQLMQAIAKLSGGMFTYASEIDELSLFFKKQILLTLYMAKFAEEISELYSREVLRAFLQEKTGNYVSDEELDLFILYIKTLTRQNSSDSAPIQGRQNVITYPSSEDPDSRGITSCVCFMIGFCCFLPWIFNLKYCCSGNKTAKIFSCLSFLMLIAVPLVIIIALALNQKL